MIFSTLSILQRVLVNYFYKVNAGLFTFVFFVLFGLPYSVLAFHNSLITGIIHSQVFLLVVMACWLLYNLKCVDYIVRQLQHQQQNFLFILTCLEYRVNYFFLLYVQLLVSLPVLLYAAVIVLMAYRKHEYGPAVEVVLFHLLVLFTTPMLYVRVLQRRITRVRFSLFGAAWKVRKPFFLFPIYFLLADKKQMLLITKVFSLLLLYGFIRMYSPERYDLRPLQLCLLLVAAAHCTIVYETRLFEEEYLAFSRNLPFTIAGRFARIAGMYAALLVPEFIFLLKGLHLHFILRDYPQLLLMLIALLAMFHVVLLLEKANMEQYIRIVFGILAGCFFIVLYDPGMILAAAMLIVAFILYSAYYYHYEG